MMPGQFPFYTLEMFLIGNVLKAPEDAAECVGAGRVSDRFEVCQDCAGRRNSAESINRKAVLVFKGTGKESGADVDGVREAAGNLIF